MSVIKVVGRLIVPILLLAALTATARPAWVSAAESQAQPAAEQQPQGGGEANLVLPDLSSVDFHGINGRSLLMSGLLVFGSAQAGL
jgi:hypothetical protein